MECLARLLEEREGDGTTLFNRLKRPAQGPSWSHFKNLTKRLEWLDSLGDTDVWMDGMAAGKVTDFAGKADAADVAELRDYRPVKRLALAACLVHKGVRARPPAGLRPDAPHQNGKDSTFYRSSKTSEYVHIDALFGEPGKNVIDRDLIESQFRHLMRVAVSVREGAISSSTLLKRLRSGSRKNAT
ncbi:MULTISPECIES: Tn3 family transposase [unclassified Streptomyces]|uniref:Tn3 family transposase n=1 Tax=unclassified Streptomyces TaxID=2593676 RepID=UPI0033A74E0E